MPLPLGDAPPLAPRTVRTVGTDRHRLLVWGYCTVSTVPDDAGTAPAVRPPDVAALYAAHHGALRRVARSTLPLHLRAETDAALMDVFTRLVQYAAEDRLPAPASWEAYLVTAVKNACREIGRRWPVEDRQDGAADELDRRTAPDPTGDTAVDRAVLTEALRSLAEQDPRLRLIVLAVHEGRSRQDIGRELGITGQRVGQLYKQSLTLLRDEEVNGSHE